MRQVHIRDKIHEMPINRQISYQNGGYCVNLRIVRIQLLNKWVRILPGAVGEFILPCGFDTTGNWRASAIPVAEKM